jgi:hypothetical protein
VCTRDVFCVGVLFLLGLSFFGSVYQLFDSSFGERVDIFGVVFEFFGFTTYALVEEPSVVLVCLKLF